MYDRARLYLKKDIYSHPDTDGLFLRSIKRNIAFHRSHCKAYDSILRNGGYHPRNVKCIEDLGKIPFLTTLYLKRHRLLSMEVKRLPVTAVSSGTSGMQSFVGINMKALIYSGIMTYRLISYHQIISWKPTNYLILGYEPHRSNASMISKTQGATTFFAPPRHKEYALKFRENGYELDYDGIMSALKRYAGQKSPVRLIGFPAYVYFLLKRLTDENISYQLPKGSMILTGGGWKEFYHEKVEKQELYRMAKEVLGISEGNCREFFGVSEHPVLYCSCPNHHFHVPNYSRMLIRDTVTLLPVDKGETGLVNLLSPVADSMPLVSILTDDLGMLRDGEECGCGIKTPYLEIVGRAGVREIRTCAVDAAAFINDEGRDGKKENRKYRK